MEEERILVGRGGVGGRRGNEKRGEGRIRRREEKGEGGDGRRREGGKEKGRRREGGMEGGMEGGRERRWFLDMLWPRPFFFVRSTMV